MLEGTCIVMIIPPERERRGRRAERREKMGRMCGMREERDGRKETRDFVLISSTSSISVQNLLSFLFPSLRLFFLSPLSFNTAASPAIAPHCHSLRVHSLASLAPSRSLSLSLSSSVSRLLLIPSHRTLRLLPTCTSLIPTFSPAPPLLLPSRLNLPHSFLLACISLTPRTPPLSYRPERHIHIPRSTSARSKLWQRVCLLRE